MWKLKHQWIKAEMQQEIKSYLEANENENTAFKNVGEAAKAQVLQSEVLLLSCELGPATLEDEWPRWTRWDRPRWASLPGLL